MKSEGMTEAEAIEKQREDRVKKEARKHRQKTESKSIKRARKAKAKAGRTTDAQQGAIPGESDRNQPNRQSGETFRIITISSIKKVVLFY
jgi:hypothetical protein